jgi:hypothetical protein
MNQQGGARAVADRWRDAARVWRKAARLWGAAAIATALMSGSSPAAEPSVGPVAAAAPFDLFTESEAAAWNTSGPKKEAQFNTRDLRDDHSAPTCDSTSDNDADNPKIRILAPVLGKPLNTPLDLDLLFVPTGSAPIRPETFRLCYLGFVTMDITKRITDRASVSERGVRVSGAQLPSGHHRLLMIIADERGRLGRHEAVFDVQ